MEVSVPVELLLIVIILLVQGINLLVVRGSNGRQATSIRSELDRAVDALRKQLDRDIEAKTPKVDQGFDPYKIYGPPKGEPEEGG